MRTALLPTGPFTWRFSLSGDQGLSILAAGSPSSVSIACDTTNPADAVEATDASGHSGLSYDATTDQYTYVGSTNKAWAGTCRQLVVTLTDGTEHRAHFQFLR